MCSVVVMDQHAADHNALPLAASGAPPENDYAQQSSRTVAVFVRAEQTHSSIASKQLGITARLIHTGLVA